MINGVNSVDFNFGKDKKTKISTALPQARSELITVFQYAYAKPELTMAARNLPKVNLMEPPQTPKGLERVHVQHLQTHAQLRNNKWNYSNFYSNNATAATTAAAMDTAIDAACKIQYNHNNNNNNISTSANNNNTTNNNNNNKINKNNFIDNKSAFIKCNSDEQLRQQQQQPTFNAAFNNGIGEPKQIYSDTFMLNGGDKITIDGDNGNLRPNYNRTKDQENAFRRIEDVHNYAKLKRYGNSNESSDGSTRDFDDDDDEEEDDDDEDEDDDGDVEDDIDADVDFNCSLVQNQVGKNFKSSTKSHVISVGAGFLQTKKTNPKNFIRTPSKSSSNEDNDAIVDVETVPLENEQQLMQSPPAHHARRPMNAFLIFCKRHRAIVKDRYKSLENRAITKILGDWWASLDNTEKECFTKLAQQNKDAFFSAHPNFKWYKLPAPPLRTLSTRPTNAEQRGTDGIEHDPTAAVETSKFSAKSQSGGFFKLADETQMGELNSLIDEGNNKSECPLQKALGETTHFLSAVVVDADSNGRISSHINKRRAITENSFSSNSSEDDVIPKKSSRSCKGKIYQELVSSGQIAPIAKKTKQTKAANLAVGNFNNDLQAGDFNYAAGGHEGFNASSYLRAMDMRASKAKRAFSESDASLQQQQHLGEHIGEQFDLEEKIKQLPALSLDAYLQRKRNTKKKKKFTSRKRNSHSVSLPITDHHQQQQQQRPNATVSAAAAKSIVRQQQQQQQHAAVGSQKRKARKESITRRDVSAIENEVASLMPLPTNYDMPNGHYYYDDKPQNAATPSATTSTLNINAANSGADNASRVFSNYADGITPTSDLFILAEVAAKRTEITNQH